MSLASPLWLLLSALGLLVVALHLRRRRTVEVPSVRLWQRVADASRARASRRPRANLLMLLQLLAVLLVALALARPLWGNAPSWDHWIVVLDTSGSMQATDASPSRFAAAREKLQQMLADQWRDHGRVSVVAAGLKPYIAGARLDDVQDVQAVLDGLRPDSGPASWRDAAALLPSLVKGDEAVRVSILTDGADNGAARQAISAVLPNATIGATSVGSVTSNTGLTAVTVSPMDLKEGRWQVAGQLERFADAPGEVPVTLLFEPQGSEGALPWVSETVPAKAGARAAFSFEVTLPGPGVLEVRLPDDPFGQDNHAYFVLRSSPRSARVLHIGPSDPPLNRALQAVPNLELFQADTLPDSSEDYDLVIVDQT
ncbi:MAG TPA: VWA domain-containing protein, partial [Trueperaceae bacterium]